MEPSGDRVGWFWCDFSYYLLKTLPSNIPGVSSRDTKCSDPVKERRGSLTFTNNISGSRMFKISTRLRKLLNIEEKNSKLT